LICGFTVFPFCKKLIAGDTEMVRYLSDVHGKSIINKTVIIGSGLHGDLKPFLDFKKTYEINNKLIGVGGVIEQRNFIFPILVFNKLLKIFPDLTFKIIGHVYYDAVVKLIKKLGIEDKVIITEELPHDEVIEELKKSDVYFGIMTAKYLGLGTATLEAMMLGVPTISNVPPYYFDNPPMIDMENYIYANINEIDEATKKVEKVLTDYTLREHIGEKGKEFAMTCEHFNWDKIAEKMEILFNNIVRK
jgi:glycosyltransferase involved in cell wall biosynthesis